ncbi:MAG: hypothetical protein WA610_12510 [Thermodesulfovibrionales bacterium]
MKTQDTTKRSKTRMQGPGGKEQTPGSYAAYGDKTPICINVNCVMRRQATCFGFEGCPGFKAKG